MNRDKQRTPDAGVYALDCSATVYPYLATKKVNQIFRMALELDEEIDLDMLRKAVRGMPTMFVTLRKDRDTYRLQTMRDAEAAICPEPAVYCQPFRLENGGNLLRVTYKGNRLGIEVFRSISDGAGGMILLKTIAAEYYRAKGEDIPCECGVCACDEPAKDSETEDSFRKNYEPQLDGISRKAKHAFQFSENGPFEPWHQTEIRIPLQSLKAVTKAHGATITEYVVSLYLDKILSYCYDGVISLMFSSRLATRALESVMCERLRQAGVDFDVVTLP